MRSACRRVSDLFDTSASVAHVRPASLLPRLNCLRWLHKDVGSSHTGSSPAQDREVAPARPVSQAERRLAEDALQYLECKSGRRRGEEGDEEEPMPESATKALLQSRDITSGAPVLARLRPGFRPVVAAISTAFHDAPARPRPMGQSWCAWDTERRHANPYLHTQSELLAIAERAIEHDPELHLYMPHLRRVFAASAIHTRSMLIPPADILVPLTPARLDAHCQAVREAATRLGVAAVQALFEDIGGRPADGFMHKWHSATSAQMPQGSVAVNAAAGLTGRVREFASGVGGCIGGFVQLNDTHYMLSETCPLIVCTSVEVTSRIWAAGVVGSIALARDKFRDDAEKRDNAFKAILISLGLFGDGASSTLVVREGDRATLASPSLRGRPKLLMIASASCVAPQTTQSTDIEHHMGGLGVLLGKDLAAIGCANGRVLIPAVLRAAGLDSLAQVTHHCVHPGGRTMLDAYRLQWGLPRRNDLRASYKSLGANGNMASPTVPHILQLLLAGENGRPLVEGDIVLAFGTGPGIVNSATVYKVIL